MRAAGKSDMDTLEKRYSISEVSALTEVPDYVLRQWEMKFPPLKPQRTRSRRRFYVSKDIDIVRRIKQLLWHEKLSTEGARLRLIQELHGEGRPKTRQEVNGLLDRMESEVREMLDLLDSG